MDWRIEMGMRFYQQIEAVRKAHPNMNWRWEHTSDTSLSYDDVKVICKLAGCWCDEPSGYVRFYTNQNHPEHGGRPL